MRQVLECFELQPENSTFLELIPLFPKVLFSTLFFFDVSFIGVRLAKVALLNVFQVAKVYVSYHLTSSIDCCDSSFSYS